ncbi:hypothetical protein ACFLXJ_04615 [Chloroflexota bacterium]
MNETIPAQLARLNIDRIKDYKELLDFYHGQQWEGRERRGERRLTFNYARVFIDKIASYLMSGINFAVDAVADSDEARAGARKTEAALYRVYEDNNLEQLDLETEIDCAILGDACYKVIWDTTKKKVRVTAPDIQGLYAWWLGDDTSQVWRVASKYSLSAEETELLYQVKPRGKTATTDNNLDFNKYCEELRKEYPTIDFDNEVEKFNLYWSEGAEPLKRPKLALKMWMDKAVQFQKKQKYEEDRERRIAEEESRIAEEEARRVLREIDEELRLERERKKSGVRALPKEYTDPEDL